MRSSPTITLFTESSDFSQQPTSFVASIFFHCMGLSLLSFGFFYSPHLDTRAIAERYTVRNIDLETPEQQMRRAERREVNYPRTQPEKKPALHGGKPDTPPPVLRRVAQAHKGPQTLIQADLPTQLTLAQAVPVPTIVIWSPQKAPVKNIVAPLPEKPTAAAITPAPNIPNEAVNLADISIAPLSVPTPKLPTLPTTTSPAAIQAPDQVQMAPATVSQPTAQPTPAAVMSLSDLRMTQGTVVLPPVNETAAADSPGALAQGKTTDSLAPGKTDQPGNGGATPGPASGVDPPGPPGSAAKVVGQDSSAPNQTDAGSDQSDKPSATQITLPKDGQFGAVVVGASLQDEFPEMATVWGGRLAYTVYLHVGLSRSWILQYSLPRTDEAEAAGNIARLEAPWPYSIVRPNLPRDNADLNTIMVHGFISTAGRFETLGIVFPPQFPLAQFVLASLQNWQFRPATQNGQNARVEVLLIIPEEMQ
jgi:hypothetical protein